MICHVISRLACAWAILISHLFRPIIILDFPSGESSISFDKQGYDPWQVTLLTIKLLHYYQYKHIFYIDLLELSVPSTVFLSPFSMIALCVLNT